MFATALSEMQVLIVYGICGFVATFSVAYVVAGLLGILQSRAEAVREGRAE